MVHNSVITDVEFNFEPLYNVFNTKKYYRVGEYQRGFSWGEEQFEQLFTDFHGSFEEAPSDTYLLGQIIICPTREYNNKIRNYVQQYDLIDGQQRSTSLLILFFCIRQVLSEYLSDENGNIDLSIVGDFWDELKTMTQLTMTDQQEAPRVKPAANGEEFLKAMLGGFTLPEPSNGTQRNITVAWEYFTEKIKKTFPATEQERLVAFTEYLMHKVYIVAVLVPEAARAVTIFQKVNNRGLALDESDLIKSFLFLRANPDEFNSYSKSWDAASGNIFNCRLKRTQSMEFLLKLMIGIRKGSSISTTRLYEEWQKMLDFPADNPEFYATSKFAKDLEDKSKCLQNITVGNYPNGTPGHLGIGRGIYELKAVQQHEIQLAGSHLLSESYDKLLAIIEDRTLLSLWSSELPQEFERVIHPWAQAVSNLDPAATLEEIQEASREAFSINSFEILFTKLESEIQNWDYNTQSHRQRIRYFLARIYHAAENQIDEVVSVSECMKTTRYRQGEVIEKGFDIDHILPESQAAHWRQNTRLNSELGSESRFEKKVHSIGNLILLHSRDNWTQGNELPWDGVKKQNLGQSKFVLNKFLVDEHYYGQLNERVKEPVATWRTHFNHQASQWDEESIDVRRKMYLSILKEEFSRNLIF